MEREDIRHLVYKKYHTLINSCKNLETENDMRQFRLAFKTAVRTHGEKILSIIDVALILTEEIGLGRTSIICTLLHSSLPKDTNIRDIENEYGAKVAQILNGLFEIDKLYSTQKIINSENFRKMLLSFAEDIRVQLIFLAEKLYALRHANKMDDVSRDKLIKETNYIFIPFAHRLGLYNIKSEMEDTALKYSNPEIYNEISRKLSASKDTMESYITTFAAPIQEELKKRGIKFKMKYRTKTIASILNKMKKQQIEFEEIYDIFAIRFIIDSVGENEKPDCWKVYSIVTDKYTPNTQRLRDWLSVPKSNGYESLQITVLGPLGRWVEVQIRTERMDDIAEKGFAAHWKYKGGSADSAIENWINELRDVLESHESNAIDLLDDMHIDLQDKEVHVFTPKGDLFTLQAGSTLLDFAYAIHTKIGFSCIGGVVNNRNESIRYQLKNGDQISIITSSQQTPNADWLNFTVTSKARNKIRQYIKEQENKEADTGKEMLMRRMKNWKIDYNEENIRKLMQYYKYKFATELYQGIATGKHDLSTIKDILIGKEEIPTQTAQPRTQDVRIIKKADNDVLLIDRNVNNVDYKFAKCCNPVFGDDIIGFVSIGDGIKVHRSQCKNAMELQRRYPYRIVNTQWTNDGASSYQAVINLSGTSDVDIISRISELVNKDPHTTLRGISINSGDGYFDGSITVLVGNTEYLSQLISRLKQVKGMKKVSRRDSMVED